MRMVAWSHLPNEIKVEIVKRMDLRTRFCFRHVSSSTMTLVDSTRLYIPRIQIRAASDHDIYVAIFETITNCVVIYYKKTALGGCFDWHSGDPTSRESMQKRRARKSKFITIAEPLNSLAATLKTLTSGYKTILGGLEITGTFTDAGRLKLLPLLEGCRIRTKIISMDSEASCFPFLMKCSRSDVQEIQVWGNEVDGVRGREGEREPKIKTSYVKSIRFSVDEDKVPEEKRCLLYRYDDGETRAEVEGNFPKIDENSFLVGDFGQKLEFFHTSCGFMSRLYPRDLVEEKPQKCIRRWRCEKHSDPFEFWYGRCDPFGEETIKVTNTFEQIWPVVNGVCPVKKYFDEMDVDFVRWKKLAEMEKYRWRHRIEPRRPPQKLGNFRLQLELLAELWFEISFWVWIVVVFYVFGRIVYYLCGF